MTNLDIQPYALSSARGIVNFACAPQHNLSQIAPQEGTERIAPDTGGKPLKPVRPSEPLQCRPSLWMRRWTRRLRQGNSSGLRLQNNVEGERCQC